MVSARNSSATCCRSFSGRRRKSAGQPIVSSKGVGVTPIGFAIVMITTIPASTRWQIEVVQIDSGKWQRSDPTREPTQNKGIPKLLFKRPEPVARLHGPGHSLGGAPQ